MRLAHEVQLQKVWGWKIAAYLFGAGMGAGAFGIGSASLIIPGLGSRSAAMFAMVLGTALVILSVPFLIWDLERPLGFFRVLWRAKRSWISRGAYILMIFSVLAILNLLFGAPPALNLLSLLGAIAVGAYTGLLIGTMLARPIWFTPILPVLFLVSAFSTGIAATNLAGVVLGQQEVVAMGAGLQLTHIVLLVAELLVLYFYLNIVYGRTPEGVELLLRGQLAGAFWVGIVVVGLGAPLILEAVGGSVAVMSTLAAMGVLVGGFMLRRVVLSAGTRARVYMGVPFVIRPEV